MKRYILYIILCAVITVTYELILMGSVNNMGYLDGFESFLVFIAIVSPLVVDFFLYKKLKVKKDKEDNLFVKDWTLIDFAKEFGPRMQVGEFYTISGKSYHKCVFTRPDGKQTYVGFFSQLGELTNQEISDRKNELKVGLTASQKYYLHDSNVEMWEEVKL